MDNDIPEIKELILQFSKLPGLGPKSAKRMVLKLINTKNLKTTIDIESEFKKAINYERNRQLNQYSKIYYNKIKKNLDFNG